MFHKTYNSFMYCWLASITSSFQGRCLYDLNTKIMAEENSSAAGSSSRAQRNKKEKHRRMHMKDLISQLASLIPSRSKLSMPEILDEATRYITHLQKNKESLERRRALLKEEDHTEPTVMNITISGPTLEVNLICGSNRNFMFHEIISVLEEGAAEVINVTQFNSGDQIIFSVQSKAINSRIGVETDRVQERLKELIL